MATALLVRSGTIRFNRSAAQRGPLIHIKGPGPRVCKSQMHHRLSLRAVMTSVVRFIKEAELGSVFDDQATKAMGEAFDAACKVLNETGQSSVIYEAVAKCIIEIAKSGERDPNQLRDRALAACGHKRLIPLLPRN